MPIIPNMKQGSGGGSGDVNVNIQGVNDHEKLGNLYGGDALSGHWHLTREEYLKLKRLLDGDIPTPTPPDGYDGGFPNTPDDDYDRELDGGYPPNDHSGNIDGGLELLTILDAESGGGDMDGGEII